MSEKFTMLIGADVADMDDFVSIGYWSNGQVSLRTRYKDGRTHGLFETFTPYGQRDCVSYLGHSLYEGEKIKFTF